MHQFKTYRDFDAKKSVQAKADGLLFKKVVIADRLAVIVDTVYNNPSHDDGILYHCHSCFAIQIYCDFSLLDIAGKC